MSKCWSASEHPPRARGHSHNDRRSARLTKSQQVSSDDQTNVKETVELYQKVRQDFQKAGLQDRKALIARVQQPLQQRQMQLDRYLTEALLGLQRLRQHSANKDR